MAASAYGLTDALPQTVYETGNLLDSCSRCPHNADTATPDRIGKGKRSPIDDGRTAIWSHNQQTPSCGGTLEGHFLPHGDVVGKDHHIESGLDGFESLCSGKGTGYGYERERGVGVFGHGTAQRSRRRKDADFSRTAFFRTQGFGSFGKGVVQHAFISLDDDNQITGFDHGRFCQQTALDQKIHVGGSAHEHRGFGNAFKFHEVGRNTHESD